MRHIIILLNLAVILGFLQACGLAVDPLDSFGPPKKGEEGYSPCADATLLDTDQDGMSDECEKLLGTDLNSKDSDGDGIGDNEDDPNIPNPTPEQQAGTQALGNNLLNQLAEPSLLANSALNNSAPNGTRISVKSQVVQIAYNNSGAAGVDGATALCGSTGTFLYYKVVGDVMFCMEDSGCEPETPKTRATMELCGPLPALTSVSPSGDVVESQFQWTAGRVQTYYHSDMLFDPSLLYGRNDKHVKLTLTPSNSQTSNSVSQYQKLRVKFEKSFPIEGTIHKTEDNPAMTVDSGGNISISRNFKRTTLSSPNDPGIVGYWGIE